MLVLPVDEDAWLFRVCLYVGMALLLLDVVLPRLFRRRVRLVMPPPPRVLPPLPRARVVDKKHFRHRKRELERQIRALETGEDAGADAVSEREDERVVRRSEEPQTASHAYRRSVKAKATTATATAKLASRVVMPGDREEEDEERKENEVFVGSASRSASKRVSFDMTRNESDADRRPSPLEELHASGRSNENQAPVRMNDKREAFAVRFGSEAATAAATTRSSPSPVATSHTEAYPAHSATRPDPFSLVDDDFPWQLPNYGTMSASAAPSTAPSFSLTAPTQLAPPVHEPFAPLNVRRPFGQLNGTSSSSAASSVSLGAASSFELKHKPLWKRPTRETANDTDAAQSSAAPAAQTLQTTSTTTSASATHHQTNRYESSSAAQIPQRTSLSSMPFQKWRMPSPKPPRPPRQSQPSVAHHTTTSAADRTPVAAQSKLRTPKIVRRITFDEDMMGALATPSDASPFVTDSTRKRQRDHDVLEALDAVGLPWHKRRLNSDD